MLLYFYYIKTVILFMIVY